MVETETCHHNWVIRPYDLQMVGPQLPNRLHLSCYRCNKERYYEIDHAAAQREAKAREHYDDLHDWAKRWQEGRRKNTEEQKRTPARRLRDLSARIILEARAMNKELDAILEALAAVTPQQAE